ncbi:glutamate carboxypeptidase [Propionicimonas paludicola]|uniref:Glutamate carboxypeptidase n=1 Tax=Propionicimonas paludicola TaxID=185243 RepID=A0A2A9CX17_9ACTN|nr:M20/M25/M40 family metallo-hydrolase [Propionicimonas paludicola]PFG18119.1 glutamate carboxypeptidase [Propionicimonas paludicola]
MAQSVADRIREQLDEQALVAELTTLIELESPSHDLASSAEIAGLLAAAWTTLGEARIEPSSAGSHLIVDVPSVASSETSPVLLLGHSDTVWPIGTLVGSVPFSVADGVLRGPGAYDMKSGLVVMLAAVRALAALDLPRPPIRVLIAADEEVGSGSATALVREAAAGVQAVFGFESPHPDGALKVGRLGSTRVKLKVVGRESHAALDPDGGVSAIEELVDQLLVLRTEVARVSAARPGEVLVNVGGVSGGGRTNVVPGAAEALIGFRFASAAAEADVMAVLDGLAPVRPGAVIELEVLSSRPAWAASSADQALLARVGELAGLEVPGRPAAGAADTNTTGSLGIPTLDGFGPRGGGAHAVSEHVLLASLLDRIVLLGTVLTGLA